MSEGKNPDLSAEDRDRIIKKIVENPNITQKEIEEETGIIPQNQERELLVPWIKKNTRLVFGEDIQWEPLILHSMRDTSITPDLVSTIPKCRPVIVEVKFKFDFPHVSNNGRTDREHKSMGQILQYACAYRREYPSTQIPRLFIVSIDYSLDVKEVCQFLQMNGVDIQHLSIKNILSKQGISNSSSFRGSP